MLLGYLYLLIPFIIFICGWVKPWIAVIGLAILSFCTFTIWNEQKTSLKSDLKKISLKVWIVCILIITLWVLFSGIGGFSYQNSDHSYRNRIYEILVTHPWPVTGASFNSADISQDSRLVYYIGFWLPSALVGKIFGLEAGYIFQVIWAVLGISVVYLLVTKYTGIFKIWPLILFVGFSGLDLIGYLIIQGNIPLPWEHIEWWSSIWQFSSFTTQLYWVFNQALPAWIATMLLLNQKSNRWSVLVLGLLLLNSTLPFMGLLPAAVYLCLSRKYEGRKYLSRDWIAVFVKDSFTVENILGGGFAGILTFLYLSGNRAGSMCSIMNIFESFDIFYVYILFFILEAGIYLICTYKSCRDKGLFFIVTACLLFCPVFCIGEGMDLCMRASVPALMVLYLQVCMKLQTINIRHLKLSDAVLIIILLIGAVTPYNEISRSVIGTATDIAEYGQVNLTSVSEVNVMTEVNFSGTQTGNLFSEYIARK